jgi:hypothetical protein
MRVTYEEGVPGSGGTPKISSTHTRRSGERGGLERCGQVAQLFATVTSDAELCALKPRHELAKCHAQHAEWTCC